MDKPSIRAATPRDARPLAHLFRAEAEWAQQLAGYYELEPEFDWEESVRQRISSPRGAVLVAETDSTLVGFIHVRMVRMGGPTGPRSWVDRLRRKRATRSRLPIKALSFAVIEGCYVDAQYRGNGVGSALVEGAFEWCRLREARRIELGVLVNNEAALSFWENHGFKAFRIGLDKREV